MAKIGRIGAIIAVVVIVGFAVMPALASAADISVFPKGFWGPIIECGGKGQPACDLCGALDTIQRIIYFGLTLLFFVITPALIIWAGFRMMTSVGSSEATGEARKLLTGTLVGLCIALFAWFIVDTIFKFVVKPGVIPGSGKWYEVECKDLKDLLPSFETDDGGGGPPGVTPAGCQGGCQSIAQNVPGLNCKHGCGADARVIDKLKCTMGKPNHPALFVTEAVPTRASTTSACHQAGCCIDVIITDYNPRDPNRCQKVKAAEDALAQCGFYGFYNEYAAPCGHPIEGVTTGDNLHIQGYS